MAPSAVPLLLLLLPRQLAAGATVGGAVYYDVNGNGARDAGEAGVGNAGVQVRTCSDGRAGNVRTNSGGEFSLELDDPGCYYARFDVTKHNFTVQGTGSDVDPATGRTGGVTIDEGGEAFWYAGVVPPPGSGITVPPTDPPTTNSPTDPPTTNSPTEPPTDPPTAGPTSVPSTRPSESPSSSGEPSAAPTASRAPSGYPTVTVPPSACVVRDVVGDSILSSAPILRSSFGTVFSVSTPPAAEDDGKESLLIGDGGGDVNATDGREDWGEDSITITSFSLRVLTPLLTQVSDANYQVWYRPGDYRPGPNSTATVDGRGNLDEWTLIAEANSLGTPGQDEASATYQEPLLLDSNFLSGAYPSDTGRYAEAPSTLSTDGGMDIDREGARIRTYLYRIPRSVFQPVSIAKHGGKASFYVTLTRAALQYGDAEDDEWDVVDVENGAYDQSDEGDMNVRIHVGEGVTSNPWSDNVAFYQPRRFLGKVWYEHTTNVPCGMHVGAPSEAPSEWRVPPPPGMDAYAGKAVNTTFVLSMFKQQGIDEARRMDDQVINAFWPMMLGFLNEEWVMGHCVWGTALDVEFQRLSLLELDGARRRRLRGRRLRGGSPNGSAGLSPFLNLNGRRLQTDITLLQVEMFIEGVVFDDARACPADAVPATPTTRGENWDGTMSQIGIDFILGNADELIERLQEAHPYFDNVFTLSADPNLLERPKETTEAVETETTEEDNSLLIIVAAACGAAVLLCLLGIFCYLRKRKARSKEEVGEQRQEEKVVLSEPDSGPVLHYPEEDDSVSENVEKEVAPEPVEEKEERGYDPDDFVEEEQEEEELEEEEEEEELPEPPEPPKPVIPLIGDPLKNASPSLRKVPQLEEIIMLRGLPRRRSEPNMVTGPVRPSAFARTRSLSCLREVWINLNTPSSKNNPDLAGGYLDQLLDGTLYPVDDHDILYWERERYLRSEDALAPYVPHGGSIEHNFIDESEAMRVESHKARSAIGEVLSDDAFGDGEEAAATTAATAKPMFKVKQNPLVMQQVEMLEAKWKQLREEFDEEGEYDDDENNLDRFDVNDRIEQLMGHIEKLELERKMRLASLKQQEEEEDELARKRMVRAGMGINYQEELSRDFVIRKKKKSSKSKKAVEDLDYDDISEESSSEEEEEDADFDVKWMRLKVPLAAQDPGAMRSLVNKGKDMDE